MANYEIRARFDDFTVRVYQAFSPEIALPAISAGKFVPPFKLSRMTWIKPSFNWMMFRSGYASKPGQEVVLAIDIAREGFEWALDNAVLSTFNSRIHSSHDKWRDLLRENPVRIQWDPERNWQLDVIENVRAIQIGLAEEAVRRYVNDWTKRIEDVTHVARSLNEAAVSGFVPEYRPDQQEDAYPLSTHLVRRLIPRV